MEEYSHTAVMKETFDIAWPSVVESVLVALAGLVDTYMVSGLGKVAVAAIGVTNQPKTFVFTVFFALNVAISALVARRLGENRREDANGLFYTGLILALVLCAVLSILCIVFAYPFMKLCGANPETIDLSVMYFRIIMGGSAFNLIFLYFNAALRGLGNTQIAMRTNIIANAVNVVMNYLLIQGHFGFPALGVKGAAIATVLGTVVAFFMSFRAMVRKDGFIQLQYIFHERIRPSFAYIKEIMNVGSSIFGENILTRIGMIYTSALTARIGTAPYSAHLVGMNFMNLGFAFGDGLQAASVSLVGRSLGEKQPDKAKAYAWNEQIFGLVISIICSAVLLLSGRWIYEKHFPGEPQMLAYGSLIISYIAVIMPIQISKIVFGGTLRGAGDVKFTLIASTIGVTVVQPLIQGFFYYQGLLTLNVVWASILLSQSIQLILFAVRFFSGKWLVHKI